VSWGRQLVNYCDFGGIVFSNFCDFCGQAFNEFSLKSPEVVDGSFYLRDRQGFENQAKLGCFSWLCGCPLLAFTLLVLSDFCTHLFFLNVFDCFIANVTLRSKFVDMNAN
jgi:hypothetical protein